MRRPSFLNRLKIVGDDVVADGIVVARLVDACPSISAAFRTMLEAPATERRYCEAVDYPKIIAGRK